jgi:putative ABC transport system ATP-binding protein
MTVLELRNVSKTYRVGPADVSALSAVDLEISAGEIVAVVGPSGSGKSTLLQIAGGVSATDGGEAWFDGVQWSAMKPRDRARTRRRSIGFVFQSFHLLPALSVLENVELPILLDGRRDRPAATRSVEAVQLSHRAHHLPAELSGGEMQRAAIARAIVQGPKLILADEPTGSLDAGAGAVVRELLGEHVRRLHASMIVATHDPETAAMADRILELRDGRVH